MTIDQLPAGNHTVNVTSDVPNYDNVSVIKELSVNNGTVDASVVVNPATYPDNATVVVSADVDGNYTVKVGNDTYVVEVKDGVGSVTVDVLPAGVYPVEVTAEIPNYDPVKVAGDDLVISNGTVDASVVVNPATYPDNATVVVSADVDGNYTVKVGNDTYVVEVKDGVGSVTVDVLPAGVYPVEVTAEIPNYDPVKVAGDDLVISNGTVEFNVTVNPATYPENATVVVNSTVDGNFTVKVGNDTYTVEVKNGTGNVTLNQLPAGNHTVDVTSIFLTMKTQPKQRM